MGGEGHMGDMIRRLKEGRDASRLRRERKDERMKRMRAGAPFPMPDISPEEMGRIIRQTKEKEKSEERYFVWGTLIVIGILLLCFVVLWLFIR